MATGATVDETGTDRRIAVDVSHAVLGAWAKTLGVSEFSLEQLASAPDCPGGVAQHDEGRRSWRHRIADACTDLLLIRLEYSRVLRIWCLCVICKLCFSGLHAADSRSKDRKHRKVLPGIPEH
ncbi:MAG TPA: hypothetical protein VFU13_21005 [Steroidobacteraceae bacterium]|nr:hypothetical protein [Steroidobacteraceae bacterium]